MKRKMYWWCGVLYTASGYGVVRCTWQAAVNANHDEHVEIIHGRPPRGRAS